MKPVRKNPIPNMTLSELDIGDVFSWGGASGQSLLAMVTDEGSYVWLTGPQTGVLYPKGENRDQSVVAHPDAEIHV